MRAVTDFYSAVNLYDLRLIVESAVISTRRCRIANPISVDENRIKRFIACHSGLARRGIVICRTSRREQLSRHVQVFPWQEP
jgi:hypothetical protein